MSQVALLSRSRLDKYTCAPLDEDPSAVILYSVVKAELHFGARSSMKVAENMERVDRFSDVFDSPSEA